MTISVTSRSILGVYIYTGALVGLGLVLHCLGVRPYQ
jgi:hypothetical protein